MAGDKRVRPWSFWRKAFWLRPALLAAYGVAALAFVPFGAHETVEAVGAGRAVSAHRLCEVDADGPCLERITGTLRGPFDVRRSVNDEYTVSGSNDVDFGPGASDQLQRWSGLAVTGLTFDGDVVVIETPDGRSYQGLGVGTRGVVQWLCLTLLGLFGGLSVIRHAIRKRRAYGGWWRVDGPTVVPTDVWLFVGAMAPALCLFFMLVGATWWLALALTAAAVVATTIAVVRGQRRAQRAQR